MESVEERMKYIVKEYRPMITFWYSPDNWRVSVGSDGYKFIATIQAGVDCETYLSVAYSSPNYAEVYEDVIPTLIVELDKTWSKIEQMELDDMLPSLYELCKVANNCYNKWLWEN